MKPAKVHSVLALCGLAFVLAQSACEPRSLKEACRDHTDCTDGRLCASVAGAPPTCVTLVSSDASVDGVDLFPPVSCGEAWVPTPLNDASEITPLLTGKWRNCGRDELPSLPSPFEFVDDGTWYTLAAQPDGSTVRRRGWGEAGTWEVDTTWAIGEPPQLLVYWNNAPGNSYSASLMFMTSPRVMQFGSRLYSPLP